jgi:hypothetical protein
MISGPIKDWVNIKKSSKKRNKPKSTIAMDGIKTKTENIENSFKSTLKCSKTDKKEEKRKSSSGSVNTLKLGTPINAAAITKK